MKIGVFDSGIGGLSVANAIKEALPDHEIIFRYDAKHFPYGSKSMDEVLAYSLPILEELVGEGVACIVVACNTISTNLIGTLRTLISVPLVAIEPMVKPAASLTKSGVFAVCATPGTLASARYAELKAEYAKGKTVLEPDCSDWATMIETNSVDREIIADRIETVLDQGADVIVLGCTHYHWIEDEILDIVKGRATVLQPEPAIVERLKTVLAEIS